MCIITRMILPGFWRVWPIDMAPFNLTECHAAAIRVSHGPSHSLEAKNIQPRRRAHVRK